MKLTILLFVSMISFVCNSQMQSSTVALKSGVILNNVIGKLKGHTFKYKENDDAKAKEVAFSEIDYVKIQFPESTRTYRFLETDDYNPTDHKQLIAVEEVVLGGKVELYTVSYNTPAAASIPGGMASSQSMVTYYVKKASDEKLTTLGPYSTLTNNLKQKVIDYFSDCKILTEKIKNHEFRVRDGLEGIVVFYNASCGAE